MFGATDVGRQRKNNQDNLYFDSRLGIAVVADGIGGRNSGEVASGIAVRGLKQAILDCESLRHEDVAPFLTEGIDKVNRQIILAGQADPQMAGMGTTVNALLFVGNKVYIGHLGDSRTYLFVNGQMWQLTLDHNIKLYVKRGWLPQEALANGKPESLVRALGLSMECEVDIYEKELYSDEMLITCSDGLTDMVPDKRIASIIKENRSHPERLPQILIAEANKQGGRDNITVIVSEVR